MRILFLFLTALLVLPLVSAEVSVTHFIDDVGENEPIIVHVIIRTDSETDIDIAEFIPEGWEISDWDVMNFEEDVSFETEAGEFMEKSYNINHWTFEGISEDVSVSYSIKPKPVGDYEIVSVWFYPEGFEMDVAEFSVTKAVPSGPITGYAVADTGKGAPGGGVSTKITIKHTVSDVLSNVNKIELY